ncbi:MAG: methionine synthase [Methanosarcinales archaeon]|nr:methionine synthase [Methanosarcinales archaeon]
MLFDDIGSFPLPKGVRVDQLTPEGYLQVVSDALERKLFAGVEVPTYPQFRDMIRMFMDPINDPRSSESPYLIRPEAAQIMELQALEETARSRELRSRVCVTGPVELYLSVFGATRYTDVLYNLAQSVARFLEQARERGICMTIASIDEPSLGISPSVIFDEDELIAALEMASAPCRGLDCEVHLHSPLYAELCCRVPHINVIGVESASHPDYLKLIDKKVLEETDSYLRAGIARTDILSMAAGLNDRLGRNLWREPQLLEKEVLALESPRMIQDRLERSVGLFGERIRCAGPDCGLGSWPSQEMASGLLSNCARAINAFRETGVRSACR